MRGKAGNQVEFGNALTLAEQIQGVIIDGELFDQESIAQTAKVEPVVARIQAVVGADKKFAVTAARGYSSRDNRQYLKAGEHYDALCPKSPADLKERRQETRFVELQKRRGNTEARAA